MEMGCLPISLCFLSTRSTSSMQGGKRHEMLPVKALAFGRPPPILGHPSPRATQDVRSNSGRPD